MLSLTTESLHILPWMIFCVFSAQSIPTFLLNSSITSSRKSLLISPTWLTSSSKGFHNTSPIVLYQCIHSANFYWVPTMCEVLFILQTRDMSLDRTKPLLRSCHFRMRFKYKSHKVIRTLKTKQGSGNRDGGGSRFVVSHWLCSNLVNSCHPH